MLEHHPGPSSSGLEARPRPRSPACRRTRGARRDPTPSPDPAPSLPSGPSTSSSRPPTPRLEAQRLGPIVAHQPAAARPGTTAPISSVKTSNAVAGSTATVTVTRTDPTWLIGPALARVRSACSLNDAELLAPVGLDLVEPRLQRGEVIGHQPVDAHPGVVVGRLDLDQPRRAQHPQVPARRGRGHPDVRRRWRWRAAARCAAARSRGDGWGRRGRRGWRPAFDQR